jgi:hypothetical protein
MIRQPRWFMTCLLLAISASGNPADLLSPGVQPEVELEENVYSYTSADNGAGPMWCHGSTSLVRIGDAVFASGLETLPSLRPLNNCRWMLFQRNFDGWRKIFVDEVGRTREPSPLVGFADGRVFVSANPTLVAAGREGGGPAQPEMLQFRTGALEEAPTALLPRWEGEPKFTEHSYRSFAADGPHGELILFQNIGYTHAEWAFLDRTGQWSAQGKLAWPWGSDYEKPEPIRVCYPNVALQQRAVHFCGVSDIIEPNRAWRDFKRQLTGREWDYDFRRLFYTWTPDVTSTKFSPWIEIASREKTCGWVNPGDLYVAPDGAVHLLWTERAIDERLRERFFPEARQSHALNYAVVRAGKVVTRQTLALAEEGGSTEIPGRGRFQVTPDQRLWVVYYVSGRNTEGKPVSENRLLEMSRDGTPGSPVRLPLKHPLSDFFTATVRGGSPPSAALELLGPRVGSPLTISYARIRLY